MPRESPCPAYAWTSIPPPDGETCEVSTEHLWGDYLTIGGSLTLPAFRSCLDGDLYCGTVQHNLVVQVLNEHLLEHGHRFPVDYRRERPADEGIDFTRLPRRCAARHRAFGALGPPGQR